MPIRVIDLFAGPGGLSEGFSRYRHRGEAVFKIKLSIEKDPFAHQTLKLRAFFRQFADRQAPQAYYEHLAGLISAERLYQKCPEEAEKASAEALHAELGGKDFPNRHIDQLIRHALGGSADWVLIGGPPCQAYSLVGRARRTNDPKFHQDKKHTLYKEYLRIIADHQPPIFVMENVKGILSARHEDEGVLARIIADLKKPLDAVYGPNANPSAGRLEYHLVSLVTANRNLLGAFEPDDFVVCAEKYGIPQARHRVILLGVLAQKNAAPRLLREQPPVQIEHVLSDLPRLRSGLSREADTSEAWRSALLEIPEAHWFRNGDLDEPVRREMRRQLGDVNGALDRGREFMPPSRRVLKCYKHWYLDPRLLAVCNHTTRSHIRKDLHRYFFAAAFAQVYDRSPKLDDFPHDLLPNHKNVAEALESGKFSDRFRVQIKGHPATTVTSHISKDGHYFIHYDPTQCRSLTVREAARLQTFPDNYFFEGPRTEQYQQVGNAVPPLLARQIAEIVAALIS
jgi:DNA (cytosine-5)-methyltransferase 1